MSVKYVSSLPELRSLIGKPCLTVVDFFATWCPPCQSISPHIDQLAKCKPHVSICKVDVDRAPDIMQTYPVKCMPTFCFFNNGKLLETFEGSDIGEVTRLVNQYEVKPAPQIPSEEELTKMRPRELLSLMKLLHISSIGLTEKKDLIDEINKYR
ncbi:unnamed protein product [Phytomonas sp. EM1]|nr:unnamed protein product [Phytomonas sp. EM1]|eukprot:CCW63419.1 unnamed protein product [Phytomonas sp. isolate EM1]